MNNPTSHHTIYHGMAQDMSKTPDNSIELVVTSPPYPMVEMWDDIMSEQNSAIRDAFDQNDGSKAFELMHAELDKVWSEVARVVMPGGIVCINIGDATRTIGGNFALYSNHSRIINHFVNNGFANLPNILWRKQTNAPNKFMGSGMLPAGAYVTLEHEWILIFRKGGKREFKQEADKQLRRASSFFWEERNTWFSDLWADVKGTKQKVNLSDCRSRSAAYPIEIPFRLINMYSLQGDTVLDPFMGTGTTALAALICNRNSVGYDIDNNFVELSREVLSSTSIKDQNLIIEERLNDHRAFIEERMTLKKKEVKHYNAILDTPVITSQEREMEFAYLTDIKLDSEGAINATYCTSAPKVVHTKKRKGKGKAANALSDQILF